MNKEQITGLWQSAKTATSKHSPEILTGIGIAGMISTTVLAVKATPKAMRLIDYKRYDIFSALDEDELPDNVCGPHDISLTAMEVIKATWKCYIPSVATGAFSIACLIGASSVNARRNAALATAYKISEEALTTYKAKVVETIGEKKEKVVREKIAKDKVEKNPPNKEAIIITGSGNTLCMDGVTGQYFESDMETVKKMVNELNAKIISNDYISLSEFYQSLGLNTTPYSDEMGWNVYTGLIELDFSTQLSPDGRPCIVLDYLTPPRYEFNKYS